METDDTCFSFLFPKEDSHEKTVNSANVQENENGKKERKTSGP